MRQSKTQPGDGWYFFFFFNTMPCRNCPAFPKLALTHSLSSYSKTGQIPCAEEESASIRLDGRQFSSSILFYIFLPCAHNAHNKPLIG